MFRNKDHQDRFDRHGRVRIEGFATAMVEEAQDFFCDTFDADHDGFHASLELDEPGVKERIHAFLAERLGPALDRVLLDYEPVSCLYVSKGNDDASLVPAHQDWSFVDEAAHRSLNVWIPLCDTNARNGALSIVEGSHRLPPTMRGTNLPVSLSASPAELAPLYSVFPMRAGDVIMYDHRMVHGSVPNRSDRRRTAATAHVVPREAPAVHYVGSVSDPARAAEVEVDETFFHRYRLDRGRYDDRSADYPLDLSGYSSREIDYRHVQIGHRDVLRVANGKGVRRRQVRARAGEIVHSWL